VYGAVDPLLVNCPFRLRDASVPKSTYAAVVLSIAIVEGAAFAGVIETGKRDKRLKPKEMTMRRTMRTCDKFIPFSSPIEPETQRLKLGQFKILTNSTRKKL
jgi:hypothetical protein